MFLHTFPAGGVCDVEARLARDNHPAAVLPGRCDAYRDVGRVRVAVRQVRAIEAKRDRKRPAYSRLDCSWRNQYIFPFLP
jgi:hypothetical protein